MNQVPIVFATDNNYAPYCGVAIYSIISHADMGSIYEIYVLYDRLSCMNKHKLGSLSTKNIHISLICIHDYMVGLEVVEHNYLTIAAVYRLVIPDIFPEYDQVLYLDSDIVVNRDISILCQTDIKDNILGAVQGYWQDTDAFTYRHMTQTFGIVIDHFFNSGVLLINCRAYRDNNVKEKCFDLLSARDDLTFMDQDALNIVCEGKVHMLPVEWNYEWLSLIEGDPDDFEMMPHPAIIHFDGNQKPWDYPYLVMSECFWDYARETIFYEEIIRKMQINNMREMINVIDIVRVRGVKKLAVYGAGNIGKQFVSSISYLRLCEITIWVDQNYKQIRNPRFKVNAVSELYRADFDHIFIAIRNVNIADEVEVLLLGMGIKRDKIVRLGE